MTEEEMVEEEVVCGEESAEVISFRHAARSKSLERVSALEEQVTASGSKLDQPMAILQQQQGLGNAVPPSQQALGQMQAPVLTLRCPALTITACPVLSVSSFTKSARSNPSERSTQRTRRWEESCLQ